MSKRPQNRLEVAEVLEEVGRIEGRRGVSENITQTISNLRETLRGASENEIQSSIAQFRAELKKAIGDNDAPFTVRVSACTTPTDFEELFSMLGIPKETWRSSKKLNEEGYGQLYKSIIYDERFEHGGWQAFVSFMGLEQKKTTSAEVLVCQTPDAFRAFFSTLGLSVDQWSDLSFLSNNGFGGLIRALYRHPILKEKKWSGFLKFMGIEKVKEDDGLDVQLEKLKLPSDFITLFTSLGIPQGKWKKTAWLAENGFTKIYRKISEDPRFTNGWRSFLKFMGEDASEPWRKRVADCQKPDAFLELFKELGAPEAWKNTTEIRNLGYGLLGAILEDARFKDGFSSFLQFMGENETGSWAKRVADCKSRKDFLNMFTVLGAPNAWKTTTGVKNLSSGLLGAIYGDPRFDTFKSFLAFMGEDVTEAWARRVSDCQRPDAFLGMFKELGAQKDEWKNVGWLREKSSGLYAAISKDSRFQDGWHTFLKFMRSEEIDNSLRNIAQLGLEELFSIFADRPGQMKMYLEANYPHMTEKEIDSLIVQGFKSFFGGNGGGRGGEYLDYDESLASIELDDYPPEETNERTIAVKGAAIGAQYVYLSGIGSRRCKVAEDGRFEVVIPLRLGQENTICLTAVNTRDKTCSSLEAFTVDQQGEVDDIEELIQLLSTMGREAVEGIRKNPGKYDHIKGRLKHVLIRKFSRSFSEGETYVRTQIDGNHSGVIKRMLKEILAEFGKVNRSEFDNVRPDQPLYLFQKYCAHLIQERIRQGKRGVILANDPGLGKTRTALAAINGDDAVIVAPNSVVSAWSEEAARCLKNPDLLVMQDMEHAKRKELLKETTAKHRVTNIQFVQKHLDDERFMLLANENTVVVQDEAHSRANLESDQTKGMRKLSEIGKFQLLLSATPFKNSKTVRRVLHTLHPDKPEYGSDNAFEKAFPSKDPKALQTLRLLLEEDMIRFTKRDALEEMDPNVPVKKQIHKLPRKEFIPPVETGEFIMSDAQAHVLYEMFLDWGKWSKKYGKYIPKDKIARMDGVRKGDALSKRHAYRQVVNDPEFVNLHGVSNAKARTVRRIVAESLKEGRKVEIFCQYNSQTQLYAEMLKEHNPSLYTGITSEEGSKRGPDGKPLLFRKDAHGQWTFDRNGYPIRDADGEPMLALDYERLTFQNAADRKIVIATYAAGAVGTTFTAAKTVIKDDLPRDCIEDEQSDDRTHRIDHEHQTHHTVKHYNLIGTYPEKFLNDMKKRWVEKLDDGTYREEKNAKKAKEKGLKTAYQQFFEQGTLDEVHFGNLQVQKNMMHLILDGIADEDVLKENQRQITGIDE